MIINKTGIKAWTNRHETFTQSIADLYDLGNDGNVNLVDYNNATIAIQGIIKEAMEANYRLRALGGGWSWTKIAATDGVILNTKLLNHCCKL
jgi:FAD/FMN-containing dehydrogenase